ncbi:hypothetical protein EDC14_1001200 [Hydrogenispora ethanolica]|uniref:Tetratricopeptide repeat protein n=1 Tax=Hydrogenispora ethanolica TaxID=1082276 RepID=A0A4R1SBH9_HYDET|nr:tetratricopeptide repeat protein [Hydrogenispora ethanolica]TCL76915.1 hypothetical protein EDC14_1001200 [Hydrogenispora ethanolica]
MRKFSLLSQMKKAPADDSGGPDRFQQAVRLHQSGLSGDKQAVREALNLLEGLQRELPEHHGVLAYYGSTLCLLGRDLTDPVERSATVIKGLKLLDQAVASEPDQFEIRIIRGNVCLNLPEIYFHRNATAVEDFQYLLSCCENYPDGIPSELYLEMLYNLSLAYSNLGKTADAAAVRDRLLAEAQDPKYRLLLEQEPARNGSAGQFLVLLQPLPTVLAEGERLHQRALAGEKQELRRAMDFFAKAQVFYPENQVFKACHADCVSLLGRDASNTGEMFANAIKAMKTIDAAVVSEPDNLKLRLIRARHSMRLPELFFARTATAITDFEYLAERRRRDPGLLTEEQWGEILFNLGQCYQRLGMDAEAEAVYQELSPTADPELQRRIAANIANSRPPEPVAGLSLSADRAGFYAEAKRLHDLGVAGNKTAARMGLELWEQAHSRDPQDPVALGYYGSSLALNGRYASDTNGMFGAAIKGLKLLNEAVSQAPDHWELRLLRGYLAYSLPEAFFHTTRQAIADFQYLIGAYRQDNRIFPADLQERLVADLAAAVRRAGSE